MVAEWRKGVREMNWELGFGGCKLLHLQWINNELLLYITGNYIQSPGINHNGKECIYITDSLCCTADWHDIVNQLYVNKNVKKKHLLKACNENGNYNYLMFLVIS